MADDRPRNLMMPGTPRYQPKSLMPYFGYDNLMIGLGRVEIAVMQTLGEINVIPPEAMALLTPELIDKVLAIRTSDVDKVERETTKHDVRAWVRIAQGILPPQLGRWLHVPLTSYDALDTGRILNYVKAYKEVIRPSIMNVIKIFTSLVRTHANTLQIGRTHGQHALPITVGFWLATILDRIVRNALQMDQAHKHLVGKISGAVGAYNAQVGLGISERCLTPEAEQAAADMSKLSGEQMRPCDFEDSVLQKLGLFAAPISTQILPPEPLANFLFAACLLSASFDQLGRDCRHLMRSEIAEVAEEFEAGQVGSSTMAHKRNPITFEQEEGMYVRNKNEFGKVMDTLVSEHQRDLTGSCVMRDFPIILVNLQCQIDALLRENKQGIPFLARMAINETACRRNFELNSHVILAEPLYIALLMAGYNGDAHKLVNDRLMPVAEQEGIMLIEALQHVARTDEDVSQALAEIPSKVCDLMYQPETYIGAASEKAIQIADMAEQFIV